MSTAKEQLLLSKLRARTAEKMAALDTPSFGTAEKVPETGIPTANIGGQVGGAIPSANMYGAGDILKSIKMKDTAPAIETNTLGAQPVPKAYSPVSDYLKKGKRQ